MRSFFAGIFILIMCGAVFAQDDGRMIEAQSFLALLLKPDVAKAYELVADEIKPKLPIEALPKVRQQFIDGFGPFVRVVTARELPDGSVLVVSEFERAMVTLAFSFDKAGKIASFVVAESKDKNPPKYETPAYADPNLFTESEVTVGSGVWKLPATLTMPKGKSNVPAIVLVHGSGPNDRDETHSNPSNKIFKDLAWGLASRGIAVLRYDKRFFAHRREAIGLKSFTINDETVDDAVLAAALLRNSPGIDPKRIYVLGHSLGGMMAPRIGQRDKNIAGLIIFAGTSRRFEDVIVEQNYYLNSLDGPPSESTLKGLEELKKLAETTGNINVSTPADTPTVLGLPVAYWADLNTYDPPAVAKTLRMPMLVLQGESDYQVTMKDFALWKNALGSRKDVTFRTYPKLTHIFMESTGTKPSPHDYDSVGHVNRQVIEDIAAWVSSNR